MKEALKVAIIGLGGFAVSHHQAILELESEGLVQLVATCDSQLERFADSDVLPDLERRGVTVYRDYIEMLDAHRDELDFVTVPTPIPLHAPMHRACIERGLAVYLEKPPTLDWRELEAMIEVDSQSPIPTQVGFNFIVQKPRQQVKSRLLNGEFGALICAGFTGFWPRSDRYFARAGWAGKLRAGDSLILDSCVGNAMAHYIHNLLFWYGKEDVLSWGKVESVEAELYRANDIESFDTVFARGVCNGVEVRVGVTHAGSDSQWQHEWFECENATILYGETDGGYEVIWKDGRRETVASTYESVNELLVHNLRHFAQLIQGIGSRPLTSLADSRAFVHFNDLLFVASGQITNVPEAFLNRSKNARGESFTAIQEIEAHLHSFAKTGLLPSEIGITWSQKGSCADAEQLSELENIVNEISDAYALAHSTNS